MAASGIVGWIGLGDQGIPIVRHLLDSGVDVVAWARRPESIDALAGHGLRRAESIGELCAQADHVGICVRTGADVDDVLIGRNLLAAMRPGTSLAIHSTIDPSLCEDFERIAIEKDIALVDAPVTRTNATLDEAQFILLVGGEASSVERQRHILDALAQHWHHMGPVGSGQRMKLINNALVAANLAMIFDALEAAAAWDLDETQVVEILKSSSGGSRQLDFINLYQPLPSQASVDLFDKDVSLFARLVSASANGPKHDLAAVAQRMVTQFKDRLNASSNAR